MKYVIERQYLLPVYQHLVVEAGSVEEACAVAVQFDDWSGADPLGNAKTDFPAVLHADEQVEDGDGARPTTITGVRAIPEDLDVKAEIGLGEYLWEDPEGRSPRAEIPGQFSDDE